VRGVAMCKSSWECKGQISHLCLARFKCGRTLHSVKNQPYSTAVFRDDIYDVIIIGIRQQDDEIISSLHCTVHTHSNGLNKSIYNQTFNVNISLWDWIFATTV